MNYAFSATDVKKYWDDVKALDGVSLKAEEGKIFGLLGPNGAGKTTLVRMLSTLLEPDSGSLEVLGIDVQKDPAKVREVIGLAGQFAAVDEFLTGAENLYMVGRLYHLDSKTARKRTNDILERMDLADAANRPVRTYSGGMRRRLDLGASLVGEPKVLFLDEPTTGLDPRTRLDLWSLIRDLVDRGATILLTTQYLEEADELADHIAILDRGKVIMEGTSDQLKSRLGGDVVEFSVADPKQQTTAVKAVRPVSKQKPQVSDDGLTVTVPVTDGSASLLAVLRALDDANIEPEKLSLHRPSLDDVFLSVTGQTASSVAAKPKAKRGRSQT